MRTKASACRALRVLGGALVVVSMLAAGVSEAVAQGWGQQRPAQAGWGQAWQPGQQGGIQQRLMRLPPAQRRLAQELLLTMPPGQRLPFLGRLQAVRPGQRLRFLQELAAVRPGVQFRRLMMSFRGLGITPEQREQMRGVLKAQQPQFQAIAQRQRVAKQALQQARRANPVNQAAVQQQLEELKKIRADLAAARKGLRDEVLKLLTPEQLEKLKKRWRIVI